MKKYISEKKMLKKLNIPNWRYMTKDKLLTFVSSLPHMNPEVAKAAIDQFPNFSNLAKDMVEIMQSSINNAISSNENISLTAMNCINETCSSLLKQLESEKSTEMDRIDIRNKIVELNQMIVDIDKQNKKFLSKNITIGATLIGTAIVAGISVLGVSSKQDFNYDYDSDDNTDSY